MKRGLVSIMMPAYNAERYIGRAIESVIAQSYSNWELIIVDDGSTDGTARIVAQFDERRIEVIHQENGGEAAARNTALAQVRGEFLAFLDADDEFLPHHLELTVGYLQAHEGLDGVYADGYYCDQEGRRLRPLSSRRRGPFEGDIFEEVVRSSDVFGPPVCVVLRRAPIEEHCLQFDPDIVIGPDWDFLTQYAEFTRFGYLDQSTCLYRVHQTNITLQVNLRRRALYLARCREKAIKTSRFNDCSIAVRSAVFYDLLVNLLCDHAGRQAVILEWDEFRQLPRTEQARLLRLMAGYHLLQGRELEMARRWLKQAWLMTPVNLKTSMVAFLSWLHPGLSQHVLGFWRRRRPAPQQDSLLPAADFGGNG